MRLKYFSTLFAALFLATPSLAAASKSEFVKKATQAGDFEIASSRLALEKSQSADVKKFAQQMIDDHTKAAQQLQTVATEAGVPPENQPVKASNKQMEDMEKLQSAKPGNFDPTYVNAQRKAHEEVIELFSTYANSGDDPKLKQFASETLPTLKSHLDHVKTLTVSKM
jgi:putative membrane protein